MPVEIPETFSESGGEVKAPERWWRAFEDPELNRLVDEAMSANMDIMVAWNRLDQSVAVARMSESSLFPNVIAKFGVSDNENFGPEESHENSSAGAAITGVNTSPPTASADATLYSLSFTASYELDLWGRLAATRDANFSEARATKADLYAMAMMVSGEIARTWYQIVEQNQQLALIDEQVELNRNYLDLLKLRYKYGSSSATDVLQQKQQLSATESERPMREMQLQVLKHKLAVLLGKPPKTDLGLPEGELPELPPLPDMGIPSDLLLNRPDVRAAKLRLVEADYRVEEAIANRYPTVSIALSASDSEEKFRSLFDNWVRNLSVNIAAPIFEAGRRKIEVERTQASAQMYLNQFADTVLKALREVEDALAREKNQIEYIEALRDRREQAQKTLDLALDKYMNGSIGYLTVLTTVQTLQQLERQIVEARRTLIEYRIALYVALGGGWELERPEPVKVSGNELEGDK